MNKLFKFILPIGLVPILANCGSKPSTDVTHYVTFHQELAEDKKVAFTKDTTDGEIIAQEPNIVAKDGYSAKWEDYTVVGKTEDFTVNAVYTENTYTARFRAKGIIVAEVPFTANDVKGEHPKLPESKTPKCPSDVWYTYEWEDYKLELNDVVINAVQSGQVEHLAKFTDGEKVIAENIPFVRDDVDSNYQLNPDIIPEKVKKYNPDEKHPTYWDVNWDFTVPADADKVVTFDAAPTKHNFELMFVDFEGKQIGDIVNYQFDTVWATLKKPEVPSKVGYTVTWPKEITYSFDTINPMKVGPMSTANKYTITYPDKRTQQVTYDSEYKLNQSASDTDLQMFYDGDRMITPTGVWTTPNNVTLVKKNVDNINFDSGYIPKFITTENGNTMGIVDNPDGGKMLEITVNNSLDSCYLNLSNDYLIQAFNTDGIKAIEFEAKASTNSSEFRSHYKVLRTDWTKPDFSNNLYESDYQAGGLGVTTDRFKTFSFKKEYFTDQDSAGGIKFIWGNFGHTGEKVYIRNIRLSTEGEIDYKGFEGGGLRISGNQYFYSTGGRGDNRFPHYIARKDFFMVAPETSAAKSVTLTNELNNGGITSLKIEKLSGATPFYIKDPVGSKEDPFYNHVESITFDIYSTVAYNGNSLKSGTYNTIPDFTPSDIHQANRWYTMVIQVSSSTTTYDGRFLYLAGGLVSNIYIDNVIVTPKA